MTGSLIATRFIADTPETATEYPAVGPNSADGRFQAVYWRCIAVFFVSSVRHNPGARHVLFTNTTPPEMDGHAMGDFLSDLGVETVQLPLSRRLPVSAFGNVLYVLDIIDHFIQRIDAARLFIFDNDCLWVRPIGPMEAALDEHGVLAYDHGYDELHDINGLSRRDLKSIYERFTGSPQRSAPLNFGGEIIAARAEECPHIMNVAEALWADTLAALANGQSWARTEEHLLSLAYRHLGYDAPTANAFIKRIWTAFRHTTAAASDLDLAVWHLPAEKKTGFRRMFHDVMDRDSPFWRAPLGDEFRRYAARKMGIPRRAPAKFALDLWAKLGERIG